MQDFVELPILRELLHLDCAPKIRRWSHVHGGGENVSLYGAGRCNLHVLGRDDVTSHLPEDHHGPSVDSTFHTTVGAHDNAAPFENHRAGDGALDAQIHLADQVATDLNRSADDEGFLDANLGVGSQACHHYIMLGRNFFLAMTIPPTSKKAAEENSSRYNTVSSRTGGRQMRFLLFIPIVLSFVVLAAHFLRAGSMVSVVCVIGFLAVLPFRQPWVARVAQVILVLGALEWVRTLVMLAMDRRELGEPYLRMAVILGVVAAVTLGSALLFQTRTLRKRYGLGGDRTQ